MKIIYVNSRTPHDFPTGTHERQDHPHALYINQTPDGKVRGSNRFRVLIVSLLINLMTTGFEFYEKSLFKDGDGTRHTEFHDNGKFDYVVQ